MIKSPDDHHNAVRKLAREYFERYPKDRYQTEVESWRNLQPFRWLAK